MESVKKNLQLAVTILGFAGTFTGIGVGWADIKTTKSDCTKNTIAIANIQATGTELSRKVYETQKMVNEGFDRRITSVEKLCSDQMTLSVQIENLKDRLAQFDKRFDHVLSLLDQITQRKP